MNTLQFSEIGTYTPKSEIDLTLGGDPSSLDTPTPKSLGFDIGFDFDAQFNPDRLGSQEKPLSLHEAAVGKLAVEGVFDESSITTLPPPAENQYDLNSDIFTGDPTIDPIEEAAKAIIELDERTRS